MKSLIIVMSQITTLHEKSHCVSTPYEGIEVLNFDLLCRVLCRAICKEYKALYKKLLLQDKLSKEEKKNLEVKTINNLQMVYHQ